MLVYLLIFIHILVIVTCVKKNSFINHKHINNDVHNNVNYKRNLYFNRILNDFNFNHKFSTHSFSHQSTTAYGVNESLPICSNNQFKCFINADNKNNPTNSNVEQSTKDKCTINILSPPPNLTGDLHIGNLLNLVCLDVHKNYLLLNNNKVNINFSNDHAGQSFQKLFDSNHFLKYKETPSNSYFDQNDVIDCDEAYEIETDKKSNLAHSICKRIKQSHIDDLRAIGIDWPYGKFTLDKDVQDLTKKVFIDFYENKILSEKNWPTLANYFNDRIEPISSAEVTHKLLPKKVYSITLPINMSSNNNSFFNILLSKFKGDKELSNVNEITIETTIPEFYYGTTGIGVSHEDYKRLKVEEVYLPKINKTVPIVPLDTLSGDYKAVKDNVLTPEENTDLEYGRDDSDKNKKIKGVLIIPGHVESDFWIGKEYNLELVNILNINGKLQNVPVHLLGCTLDDGFDDVSDIFVENGTVEVSCPVNIFDSSIRVILLPILQYVLDSPKLAKKAFEVFEHISVEPQSRRHVILNRLNDIRDWCISRHGWWGIRLPIYYLYNDFEYFKILSLDRDEAERKAESLMNLSIDEIYSKGYKLKQDKRVLDTWFTSSLLPILSQGMTNDGKSNPNQEKQRNILFTCYDILETWIVKMLLICSNLNHNSLFNEIYLHGIVSDDCGKKMSKSLNNTISLNQLINDQEINLNKFDVRYFDTTMYNTMLNMKGCASNDMTVDSNKNENQSSLSDGPPSWKNLNDVELLVRTNLIRLKLVEMCRFTDFATKYGINDRSNYILGKYYEIFKFYNKISNISNDGPQFYYPEQKEHMIDLNSSENPKLTTNITYNYNFDHNDKDINYIESMIKAKLDRCLYLMDQTIKNFSLSSCILNLENYLKTFSEYLVPFVRFTVNNRIYTIQHFDHYFVDLKSTLFPFIPTFVNSYMMNDLSMYNMKWPSNLSDSSKDNLYLGRFNEFNHILRKLRRSIASGDTNLSVELPSNLYSDFIIIFINHLARYTSFKVSNINYIKV